MSINRCRVTITMDLRFVVQNVDTKQILSIHNDHIAAQTECDQINSAVVGNVE